MQHTQLIIWAVPAALVIWAVLVSRSQLGGK